MAVTTEHQAELNRAGANISSTWGSIAYYIRRYPLGAIGGIIFLGGEETHASKRDVELLSEDVQMRATELTGSVDLVISGTNASGKAISIGVPMQVVQVVKSNGFVYSLLAALLFAVGSYFTYKVLRRREVETEVLQDNP